MYPLDRRIVAQRIYAIVKSLRKTSYLINVHFSTISRWLRNPERKQYTYKNATKEATIIECLRFLVAYQKIDESFDIVQKHHFTAFFDKSLNCTERFYTRFHYFLRHLNFQRIK
jgi:Trk-type K+ transport system membrane component